MTKRKWTKGRIVAFCVLVVMAAGMLYPLFMVLNLSFLTDKAFLKNPGALAAGDAFTAGNYATVFSKIKIFSRLLNTIGMTAAACVISCLVSMFAAYPIARNHFRASGKFYVFVLLSMFFPGSLVANIILLNDVLGIYGSPVSLVLMWAIGGIQMNVFMIVGFVKQLPRSLDEAAQVDGCGYFRYTLTVAMPLMLPILATVLTFKAVGCWNDFVGPMIYLKGETFKPLSVGLYFFKGSYSSKWNQFSAAILIIALPMIILYLFMQRYIIEGMVSGALKG